MIQFYESTLEAASRMKLLCIPGPCTIFARFQAIKQGNQASYNFLNIFKRQLKIIIDPKTKYLPCIFYFSRVKKRGKKRMANSLDHMLAPEYITITMSLADNINEVHRLHKLCGLIFWICLEIVQV